MVVGGGRVVVGVVVVLVVDVTGGGVLPPPSIQVGAPDASRPHRSPGGQQKSSPAHGMSVAIEQLPPVPEQVCPTGQHPLSPPTTTQVFL